MAVAKISCIYLKKQRFWNNCTWILVKYAIFGFKMSSQVKSDLADLTGLRKRNWSQNLGCRCLAQKTKTWHILVVSRRFGIQPFHQCTPAFYFDFHKFTVFEENMYVSYRDGGTSNPLAPSGHIHYQKVARQNTLPRY